MLQALAIGWKFKIVPRIQKKIIGIQQTRNVFPLCYFDEKNCSVGLKRLEMYRKDWDRRLGVWKDEPKHDPASNGADSFRQFGQQVSNKAISPKQKRYHRQVPADWRL